MQARIALVTGANRGIGFEIARQLARAGMRVLLTARDADKARTAAAALAADGDVRPYVCDVSREDSVAALHAAVLSDHGRVDVLVNNAGILPDRTGNTLTIAPALMREVLDTNTLGPLITAQAFMPGMLERDYGRVVNVSSASGQRASQKGHWPAYHLSKYALNGLTLQLANLAAGRNVLVNAMCPGWVHSDMGGPSAPRTPAQGADTVVWLATLPSGGPNGGFFQDRQPLDW
jgi:NAD(P)-dependent dehydrogenase (short-subunit alcohol dehydrogenase family)